jgi:hypothetical protein
MLPSVDARVQQEGGRQRGFLCGNTCPPPAQKGSLFSGTQGGWAHWVALERPNMIAGMVMSTEYTQSGIGIYLAFIPS